MIQKLLFTAIAMVMFLGLMAQRPGGGRPGMSELPPEGIITGTIHEFGTDVPMGYANVVLFSVRDTSMVAGSVTAMDGSFKMEKVPYGRFYLVANYIGFKKETVTGIMITPKKKALDLGKIELHPATENLEVVEISAQKEHIEYKIDRKVINVDQDIMAQGGTAVNALENTPSVEVDIDGNVSLRGSSSFTVLIDGRPSILQGSDALQQIPAGVIDKIEIITNPSAKYDPDGVAGIINVILKEKIEKGFNGIVNASAATNESSGFDFLLNYKHKKINFFAGADYRDNNRKGKRELENETYQNDTTIYRISTGDRGRGRVGYGVRAGIDYYLTDKTTVSILGRVGYYEFNGGGTTNLHLYTIPVTFDEYTRTETNINRNGTYYNGTLNFQHNFDDFGHKLEGMFYYSDRTGEDTDEQKEYLTDPDWNIIEDDPYNIKNDETDAKDEFRIKLDYSKPIGEEGKFEAGFQSRLEDETNNYKFYIMSCISGEWVEDTLFSNNMDFTRDIHAIYGIYSNTWKSVGYQLGLRGEYTYRKIQNKKSPEPSLIDRWDYFPTVHISKSFKNKDQVLLSYTRRIDRPRGWSLDPFLNFIDQYNYRKGNPNLKPEYIDSYELGYQKRILGSLVSLEGYYRKTKNKITRIRTLQEDGTFLHTFENLNSDYSLGFELMVNSKPVKWLNLSIMGNLYRYKLDGDIADQEVDTESTNWNGRLNAVFKLPENFRFQLNGMYRGPTVTAQGEMEGFFMTNAALRKDFFDNQLTATLSVRDIFSTGKHEFTSSGTGFYSHNFFDREAPIVSLSLSWKINNYKRQKDKNMNGDNGEMEMDSDF